MKHNILETNALGGGEPARKFGLSRKVMTWLVTLLLFVAAQGAWASNTNPNLTIVSGPTYGTSAESTSLTLRVWFWNYDGDNARFSGDVYLTIDGTQTVKLNGMWSTFTTSNEDDVKGKSGSGTYGSQGTITLNGTTVGTAQFKNLQKKQSGGSANNGKYNTIDLVLSFNEKFSFYGHTIGVQGTWNDYCDGGSQGSVSKHLTVTIPGFPRAKLVTPSRNADKLNPVTVSWSSETYNSSANTTGKWYIYRNGTLLGTTSYDTKTYTDNSIPATIGSKTYYYTVSYCPPNTTISSTKPAGLYSSSASFTIGIYSLSLADGISVTSGDVVTTSGGVNYYLAGAQLAFAFDESVLADDQSFDHFVVNNLVISGNTFAMPSANTTVAVSRTALWGSLSGADGSAEHPYLISSTAGLNLLAAKVNAGKNYSGKYFKLTTNLTYSGTDNYTAIGNGSYRFRGTFDGGGFTISGINISKATTSYQGLFGDLGVGAVVKNVNLANSVILGYDNSGGIAGRNYGTVSGCTVASTVQVQATSSSAYYHGGIVGNNYCIVSDCTSSAQLTCSSTGRFFGGIVGRNYGGTMSGNFAIGATVPSVTYYGAIVGYTEDGTLSNNYYYNCTVAGQSNATGVGCSGEDVTSNNGAVSVHTLTLAQGVSTSTSATKIYNNTNLWAQGTDIELSYSGTVSDGCALIYKVNDAAIAGNTFTMPAGDVTVTTTFEDLWGVTANADGSADHPYIITTTAGLDLLAEKVNAGNDYANTYFQLGADITYDKTVENNYTAIGTGSSNQFMGSFDGQGKTISGINVSKADNSYQGLFGYIGDGAVIKNVNLANSVILVYDYSGGIAGYSNRGTVSGCTVASDVLVQATKNVAYYHGGIVGINYNGTVSGCTSSAQLTCSSLNKYYGGIVGRNYGTVSDNFVIGATVPSVTNLGAVAGSNSSSSGTLSNNYYYNCTVEGTSNATGKGCDGSDVTDNNGAVSVHTLTLAQGVSTSTSATMSYNGTNYYAQGTTVELGGLSVNGNELGWYTVNGNKIEGNSFRMPAQNTTVGTAKETLYTITLGNGISVTTSATKTAYGTNYYASGMQVTLSFDASALADGNAFDGYKVNGEAIEGNTFTMPAGDVTVTATFEDVWGVTANADGSADHPYIITTTAELDLLAEKVNAGNDYANTYFQLGADITYDKTVENNFTAIGKSYSISFKGTFDGGGWTISGINISQASTNYQGLFGYLGEGAVVKDVNLANSVILGYFYSGGIAGYNVNGTVSGCTVASTVQVQATNSNAYYHGGIVAFNYGTVSGCTSSAQLTCASGRYYGGIVGYNRGTVSNNFVIGATVPSVDRYGAIVGYNYGKGSLSNNYYYNCTVAGQSNATGVGCQGADVTDNNGAVSVHTITLGEGISVTTSATMSYNNTDYYAKGATVALGYSGTAPEGYVFSGYKVNGEAIEGNTFTMPAADVTISVTFAEKMPYIVDLTGNEPVLLSAGQSSGEIEIVFMGLMGYASVVDLTTGETFPYADMSVSAGDGAESEIMNYAFCFDLNLDGVNDMMLQKTSDNAYTMSRISVGADKLTSDYTFLWTAFESVMSSRTFESAFGQSPTSGITFRFGEEFEDEELDFLLPLDNNSENNEMFLTSIMAKFNRSAVDEVSVENSITYDVVLKDRTLWCDGDWNTLCLPFEVDLNDKDCPLANATARTLESASLSDDGIHLVLNFGQPVEKLEAGVPYIIKWKSSANNIVNPVFKNVAIDFDYNIFYSDDDRVQFRGNWEKLTFAEERQNILMLGAENQLFWPDGTAPSVLGACRAYFLLPKPGACAAQIRSFELNFEGESETAIANLKSEQDDDSCYTLDGRKVNQQGKGGITILRGKKVLNK
ncbi:MAG: hypothetical protein E7070_11440 [Bacteroidales bacterium]|nr:hypothetical protein [Bacteroidales bacterium]